MVATARRSPLPVLLLAALLAVPLAAEESVVEASHAVAEYDDATVERLAALGRLWGKAKYFHPHLAWRDVHWDRALVETIPKVEAATSTEEYREAVEHLLAFLEDPRSEVVPAEEGSESSGQKPEEATPTFRPLDDGVVVVEARDHAGLLATQKWAGELFTEAFEAAAEAPGVVLDLRPLPGSEPDRWGQTFVSWVLRRDLPTLLATDVVLPAPRRRMHVGYTRQTGGGGSYHSGVEHQEHPVIRGEGERAVPVVVLLGDGAERLWSLAGGLQEAGVARVVQEGAGGAVIPAANRTEVELTEGISVFLRTEEVISAGGAVTFTPDLAVEPATADADPALDAALGLLRGEIDPPESRPEPPITAPRLRFEDPYEEMELPSREYRLLALFRFWNVIEHFHPYKELADRPWSDALPHFIPRLAAADTPVDYALAIAEAAARIQDTHGYLRSEKLGDYVGSHQPPITVDFVEDRLAVTWIPATAEELATAEDGEEGADETDDETDDDDTPDETADLPAALAELKVGDVIVAVDGESVEERRERLTPYLAVSTPQALDFRLRTQMLTGSEGSEATLTVAADGGTREVVLPRSHRPRLLDQLRRDAGGEVFRLLPEGYGYADLSRLTRAQVPWMFGIFRQAPAIVFDLRGYPKGTAWAITPYLAAEPATAAKFRRPAHVGVGVWQPDYRFDQPFPAGADWQYDGRIVVLIDKEAISQSEHTCLFFEAAYADVTFVGTPTNGANGDITSVPVPGDLWITFTGQEVRHADGRQLQRVGVVPDLRVEPTLEGIREGRDEVLEAAVGFLEGRIP